MKPRLLAGAALWAMAVALVTLTTTRVSAHKPITSKYTYNEDVFPVFRDRCGRCHIAGGVGPMSLLSYKDAYPWAESIRAELLADEMPAWHAGEGLGRGRDLHALLSPRDLDVMLVWVTGGTPQGSAANAPPPAEMKHDWPLGRPNLVLAAPPFTLAADTLETTHEFRLPMRSSQQLPLKAIDFLPGTPAIVRHAEILSTEPRARVLAEWAPGADAKTLKAPLRLPHNTQLAVRIHYKRTWSYEGKPMTDRSAIGLYFWDAR